MEIIIFVIPIVSPQIIRTLHRQYIPNEFEITLVVYQVSSGQMISYEMPVCLLQGLHAAILVLVNQHSGHL
jgi:hypothetical protein